jgi:hypothetical protein
MHGASAASAADPPGTSLGRLRRGTCRATTRCESAPGGGSIARQRPRASARGNAGRFSRDDNGCFGILTRRVFGDVGVRFGGSEPHRIGFPSSHPVPSLRVRTPVIPGMPSRLFGASAPVPAPPEPPVPTGSITLRPSGRADLPAGHSGVRPPHQRGSRSARSPASAGAPRRAGQ